ncbi:hypothetical protein ACWCPS_39930 [Streptomyces mauvecolor]
MSPEDADEESRLPTTRRGARSFAMESSGPRTPYAESRKEIAAALREEMDESERAYYDEIEAQLIAPGTPLPLLTESEALVLAMMLRLYADSDRLVEHMVEQLVERIDVRLEGLRPELRTPELTHPRGKGIWTLQARTRFADVLTSAWA